VLNDTCHLKLSVERIAQGGPYIKKEKREKRFNQSILGLEMPVFNFEMSIQDLNSPCLFMVIIQSFICIPCAVKLGVVVAGD